MKNTSLSKIIILIIIPILSLYIGLFLNEDLSTGGSKLDFFQTYPAVKDFSNFIYNQSYLHTRHFPLHYIILSIPHIFFEEIFVLRFIYLSTSLLLPVLLYFNLCKIYKSQKINNLIISFSLLFLPFVRASAIWPNAHLTAVIFLLAANFFFLLNLKKSKFTFKFLNIFFLSLATYCIQSYAVLFLFYLFSYYKNISKNEFFSLLMICVLFSLPGFYLILNTPTGTKLAFTKNISYTLITNLSIIFFFLLFFILNKKNVFDLKRYVFELKFTETLVIFIIFLILIFTYEKSFLLTGGGFFYKLSYFLFKNNFLFFTSSFFGLIICYIMYKNEKNLFYSIFLINLTAVAYYTSQKYFEPLLIVSILILSENFLSRNVIKNFRYSLLFYLLIFSYFIIALVNDTYNLSKVIS